MCGGGGCRAAHPGMITSFTPRCPALLVALMLAPFCRTRRCWAEPCAPAQRCVLSLNVGACPSTAVCAQPWGAGHAAPDRGARCLTTRRADLTACMAASGAGHEKLGWASPPPPHMRSPHMGQAHMGPPHP